MSARSPRLCSKAAICRTASKLWKRSWLRRWKTRTLNRRRCCGTKSSKRPPSCAMCRQHESMNLHEFLVPPAESARRKGPHDRIVMSSRVRLARNLKDAAFPGWAKKPERVRVLEMIQPAVEALPEMKEAFSETMDSLSALDKQILVERHLISREHAAKSAGSGLVLNKEETLCFMINEEDHLRMQALRPGLQLRQAWSAIDQADS